MKTLTKTILPKLSFLLIALLSMQSYAVDWELGKDDDGIIVYTADSKDSKFKQLKADTVMNHPIELFKKIMNDPSSYVNWMDGVVKSNLIKRVNDNKEYTYIVQGVPVVSNRHAVLEVLKSGDDNSFRLDVEYTPDAKTLMPKNDSYVALGALKGYYKFSKVDDNHTKIEMFAHADPGGYIPSWIVNLMIVNTPYKTLKSLESLADSMSDKPKTVAKETSDNDDDHYE